jgi:D-xylose transport system substrate-binding protein
MVKWFHFFWGIIALIFVTSCSSDESFTVGYLNPSENRIRFVKEGNYMIERLEEQNVNTMIAHAGDDDVVQLTQGYEMLEAGVDGLVIVPVNGNTIAPLVRDAIAQGVMVVAYNRLINNTDFDLFIAGDNEDYARMFCEEALKYKPEGNYVVLGGDRFDMNGLELMQHIMANLEPHIEEGQVNLLYHSFIEGWSADRAGFDMQKVIEAYGTDIDVVIACNDPMGYRAYEVLEKCDAENDVIITGQGAYPDIVKSINDGGMHMTIYHPHKELGYKTADLILDILKNGAKPQDISNASTFNGNAEIPTYRMKSRIITKENLDELVEDGVYTWDEIRN